MSLLHESFREVKDRHPFEIVAFVLLPEHLHRIWTLPPDDNDYPMRWRQIKSHFSKQCDSVYKGIPTAARERKREKAIWQLRYWEHQIRDDQDLIRHVEYIHYNPVKHGLVATPKLWPHSSFHRYVQEGRYHADWGAQERVVFDAYVGNE